MAEKWRARLKQPSLVIPLIGGAVLVAWLTVVVVSIVREEPGGEPTVKGLTAAVEQALTDRDDDELGRLVDSDSAGDNYAKNYLKRLDDAGPQRIRATVSEGGTHPVITVVADVPGQGPVCSAWSAVQDEDRWVLDAAPVVASGSTCGVVGEAGTDTTR
ncbi:hypothetical protein ACFVT5_16195 [Streptomyces sp. NPDC058001]|uniref:hypothetical protein n=1 Tax=Streptomyces sp. NPDC058001 TaxID=3346300 RepID=UPI0036EA122D